MVEGANLLQHMSGPGAYRGNFMSIDRKLGVGRKPAVMRTTRGFTLSSLTRMLQSNQLPQ